MNNCDHGCVNTLGSFNCTCRSGYYLAGNYRCFGKYVKEHYCVSFVHILVIDIDECLNKKGGCSHKCVNMAGTYRCVCPVGYVLQSNRHDCVEDTSEYIYLSLSV